MFVKLNNPLMGTEIGLTLIIGYFTSAHFVKLNNPLMGTEIPVRKERQTHQHH